jgi:hypothetical protein
MPPGVEAHTSKPTGLLPTPERSLRCQLIVLINGESMTYQTQLRPWCIVRQLPEAKIAVVERFRRYQDADALLQLMRRQTPNTQLSVMFEAPAALAPKPAH